MTAKRPDDLPSPGAQGPVFSFTPLGAEGRRDLVQLSGAPGHQGDAYVLSHQLELTALGADLDLDGKWGDTGDTFGGGVSSWRQVTTAGRDQHVQIVRRGYLFPLGLRAIFVTVFDRVFVADPANPDTDAMAYLQGTSYIKILDVTKSYPALGQPFDARSWPFTSLQVLNAQSPPLDASPPDLIGGDPQAVLPQSGGSDVRWKFHLTSTNGAIATVAVPQVFVFGESADDHGDPHDAGYAATLQAAYNALDVSRRTSSLGGVRLQFASESGVAGGTAHPTLALTLAAATTTSDPLTATTPSSPPTTASLTAIDQPAFYPALASARIRLSAAEALTRTEVNDTAGPGIAIALYDDFVAGGYSGGADTGKVYASLVTPAGLNFPADAVGGLSNPNTAITGLTAESGAIGGDVAHYAQNGSADLVTYFTSNLTELPVIFGGLPFTGILGEFINAAKTPQIMASIDTDTGAVNATYKLQASLTPWQLDNHTVFDPGSNGSLTLVTKVVVGPDGTATYSTTGTITPFTIHILGKGSALWFIDVPFNGATFHSESGSKTTVDVKVGSVVFQGPLAFVNPLQEFLKDVGGSGFAIAITPTEVKASLSVSLPSIGFGVFSLENISLSAGLEIPFLGAPAVATFGFCSQERPFSLTVCMFGGGGYFLLGLGFSSVQSVTVSLDFEGKFALDLVVASGSVSVKAGVTYTYDATAGVTLTGFLDITGQVEILGIVSITIELDLMLSYVEPAGSKPAFIQGTATLKASVHVLFFSASVSATVTKKFGNSGGDSPDNAMTATRRAAIGGDASQHPDDKWTRPSTSFTTIMGHHAAGAWTDYCGAFAG